VKVGENGFIVFPGFCPRSRSEIHGPSTSRSASSFQFQVSLQGTERRFNRARRIICLNAKRRNASGIATASYAGPAWIGDNGYTSEGLDPYIRNRRFVTYYPCVSFDLRIIFDVLDRPQELFSAFFNPSLLETLLLRFYRRFLTRRSNDTRKGIFH